ncbi:MAG: hypothetical protein GWN58_68035, partial [Anaerolineae bacterium]|nr:hypothetical protein [Anaerolineae bacterium]
DEWDVIEWISLRADSPLMAEGLVEGAVRGEGATMPCPYAYLPEDWDTYAETYLSSKTQKNLAYYQRRLERDYPGEVAYEIASSREQSDETLNALRRMHESRWTAQGASTPFTSERFV